MVFFENFKKTVVSLFSQPQEDDEDADPHVGVTWCIYVDTLGCKVFKRPFYMHFETPGEAREWASTMMGNDYAISEPYFCDSPQRAAPAFEESGSKWMYRPEQGEVA